MLKFSQLYLEGEKTPSGKHYQQTKPHQAQDQYQLGPWEAYQKGPGCLENGPGQVGKSPGSGCPKEAKSQWIQERGGQHQEDESLSQIQTLPREETQMRSYLQ